MFRCNSGYLFLLTFYITLKKNSKKLLFHILCPFLTLGQWFSNCGADKQVEQAATAGGHGWLEEKNQLKLILPY